MKKIITEEMINNLTKSKLGVLTEEDRKNCDDSLVVMLGYKAFNTGVNMVSNLPCYECVFCGEKTNSLENLNNPIVINATSYRRECDLNNEVEYQQKIKEVKEIMLSHMIEKKDLPIDYVVKDIESEFRHTAYKIKTK